MFATLTSKGQVTLPKRIREQLGLVAGSKLDFVVEADGSLRGRPLQRGAEGLFGLLHDPGRAASTVEQMNQAIGAQLADDDRRIGQAAAAPPDAAAARGKRRR
jgi:AbrB family looped-hinge helix DNA binding protein